MVIKKSQQLPLSFEKIHCQSEGCNFTSSIAQDFEFDKEHHLYLCPKHAIKCDNCDAIHDLAEMSTLKNEDKTLCQDCFDENYADCPECGAEVSKEELLSDKKGIHGCTECSFPCYSCSKIVNKDEGHEAEGDEYCSDCFYEQYTNCEDCGRLVANDSISYINDNHICQRCERNNYFTCERCAEVFPNDDSNQYKGHYYCNDCIDEVKEVEENGPEAYKHLTENLTGFDFNKKTRFLNQIQKLLPITVKDLKTKYPSIAAGLNDLIISGKGKPITQELFDAYKAQLEHDHYPVGYHGEGWDSDLQRSISTVSHENNNTTQLVLNVKINNKMEAEMEANPLLRKVFDYSNKLSIDSTHPTIKNQLGWARLELDPAKEFILVDEIQSDHGNFTNSVKKSANAIELLTRKLGTSSSEDVAAALARLSEMAQDFPNIATEAINAFAKKNGFKKIYWHTYESGKKLKNNDPPKSLYDKVPKDNFFRPSTDKPFGLDGEFLEKEAKKKSMLKLAMRLFLKNVK